MLDIQFSNCQETVGLLSVPNLKIFSLAKVIRHIFQTYMLVPYLSQLNKMQPPKQLFLGGSISFMW